TGHRDRLRDARWGTEFVLTGVADLSARQKKRVFKIFQDYADLGVAEYSGVRAAHRVSEFSDRQSFHEKVADRLECDKPVRQHGRDLVKFRRKGEFDLHDIALAQPVQRMAFSRQGRTPVIIGTPRAIRR